MGKRKNRRLRKPIRITLKIVIFIAAAAIVDIATLSTFLYWFGDTYWTQAIGTSLLLSAGLEYLIFKDEACNGK